MFKKNLNKFLDLFNIGIVKKLPRHSVRAAKELFGESPISVVEVGTYKGNNAVSILKNLNVNKIYLVDPWEEHESYSKTEPDKTNKKLSYAEKEARKRLKKFTERAVFVKKYSDNALNDLPGHHDFIYIDGDHSYIQSKKDMKRYFSKVKKGGILGGHDITNPKDNYGVARAFFEFCTEEGLNPRISRLDWWVVK